MALALDSGGVKHANFGSGGSPVTVTGITWSAATSIALVFITYNVGGVVSSITDNSGQGNVWSQRAADTAFTEWSTNPGGAFAANTITITWTGTPSFITVDVIPIDGGTTFDSGGPITGHPDPKSITTANANTMVVFGSRFSGTSNPTQGSGFTLLSGNDFQGVEYKILSSTQTLSCGWTTGTGNANGGIVDAIVATGGGGGSPLRRNSSMDGLGASGGFFSNPLARSVLGWRPSIVTARRKLIVPQRRELRLAA